MSEGLKSSFIVRALSGVALVVIVVAAVLLSKYSFIALMLAITIGSMLEFYKMAKLGGAEPLTGYGVAVGATLSTLSFIAVAERVWSLELSCMVLTSVAIISLFTLFIVELYRAKSDPIRNIATTLMGVAYVALPITLLSMLPLLWGSKSGEYMGWMVLWYIFIVWANDVGAYLFGVTMGRHRLFERISPKKSWEGFFGGCIVAVGVGVLAGYMLEQSLLFWGGLAVVVVVSGVFGDLVESMFKRSVGVKDSGAIMPGHGGFLDRFDALIMSAPFVFVYFTIFA